MCVGGRYGKFNLCVFIIQSKFDCILEESLRYLASDPSSLAHSLI